MSSVSPAYPDPMTTLHCFSGDFLLARRPPEPNRPLQAWDAADEYLIDSFAQISPRPERVLILNDQFGALTVALHANNPQNWGDSFTSRLAIEENLRLNHLPDSVAYTPSTAIPPLPAYEAILGRIPKSLAFWRQQLALLRPLLQENTVLLLVGMVKHLSSDAKEILTGLGTVEVFLVRKKALLFRVTPHKDASLLPSPPETILSLSEYSLEIGGGPNVFAREKIDEGTQLLLDQLPRMPVSSHIADLGCGNGLLGLVAKRLQPAAALYFFDESYQAVAAAEENYSRNNLSSQEPAALFSVDDGFSYYEGELFDLILCNPPFHQGHVIGDQIAWQMFTQSKRQLRPGGELWIVGNRHLNYHIKLKRIFGNCRQIAANPRFVVLSARR